MPETSKRDVILDGAHNLAPSLNSDENNPFLQRDLKWVNDPFFTRSLFHNTTRTTTLEYKSFDDVTWAGFIFQVLNGHLAVFFFLIISGYVWGDRKSSLENVFKGCMKRPVVLMIPIVLVQVLSYLVFETDPNVPFSKCFTHVFGYRNQQLWIMVALISTGPIACGVHLLLDRVPKSPQKYIALGAFSVAVMAWKMEQFAILAGIALTKALKREYVREFVQSSWFLFAPTIFILWLDPLFWRQTIPRTIVCSLFFAYIVVCRTHILARIFSWNPLVRVAKYTFSIYVWHLFGYHVFTRLMGAWRWDVKIGAFGMILFGIPFGALSGVLMYYVVEKNVNKLIRWLLKNEKVEVVVEEEKGRDIESQA